MVTATNKDELLNTNTNNYHTFDDEQKPKITTQVFCTLYIGTLITIALNASGLYIGMDNKNATCYENQKTISLANWLIISTSCFLTYQIYYIIFLTIELYGCKIPNYKEFYLCNVSLLVFMMICLAILKLVMFVVGIIELVHQYPTCHTEVHSVTSMSIAFTVINALYYAGLLY